MMDTDIRTSGHQDTDGHHSLAGLVKRRHEMQLDSQNDVITFAE
jgi:hypothetical protein